MECKRERTLFFSFKELDFTPLEIEIHRWFMKQGIIEDQLTVIDFHFHTKNVVAKFKDHQQFENFFKRHSHGIPFEKYGKIHIIPVSIAGSPWKKVQVKYVPDETDLKEIQSALGKYGRIKNVQFEIPTFDLLKTKREKLCVEMMIDKNIPSFITVMGNRYSVSYSGQTKTCSRCDLEGHEARNCEAGKKSYSQAVGGSSAAIFALEQLKNLVEEHEGKVSVMETDEEETDPDWKTKERKRRKSQKNKGLVVRRDRESEDQAKSEAFKALKKYKMLHSVKPNLNDERKKISEDQPRDQDDATEKSSGKSGLVEKESNPMRDFGTFSEKAINNEWPNSQTIPGTQDLEELSEMELESILNKEWPDKKKTSKTSIKQKTVTVESDEEHSTEEEKNEENEKKKRREMLEYYGKNNAKSVMEDDAPPKL